MVTLTSRVTCGITDPLLLLLPRSNRLNFRSCSVTLKGVPLLKRTFRMKVGLLGGLLLNSNTFRSSDMAKRKARDCRAKEGGAKLASQKWLFWSSGETPAPPPGQGIPGYFSRQMFFLTVMVATVVIDQPLRCSARAKRKAIEERLLEADLLEKRPLPFSATYVPLKTPFHFGGEEVFLAVSPNIIG
ncbi:hypothetical protein TYRP_021263 [Tyrophagus putrescentiae]|nr:hypothetical protein TYRP_021263 [Tyrophagus putrescentiae]